LTYFASACIAGLKLKRPDVVVALTDPPIIGLAALLAAFRFRAKLVISYRDLFPEVARLLEESRSRWIEWVLHRVNRILIRTADRLVALGEKMKERLIQEKGAPPHKVAIIPDWADSAAIVPGPKENRFSKTHGLVNRFVVMHSGNMGAAANLEELVEAAIYLRDLADVVFVFIGEGVRKVPLEEKVRRLGLKNVLFLPYQPKEVLTDTFSSADCFLISLKPGLAGYIMPSKLYGVLAAGRPYVAAVDEECDVVRITHRYQCGLVAQPGDPKDVAEKIRLLYNDRPLGERLGANAREAASHFDRPQGVQAYFQLCHELVDAKSEVPASP
jgi:glycosyltransferase involved in cell wall biosynthesis